MLGQQKVNSFNWFYSNTSTSQGWGTGYLVPSGRQWGDWATIVAASNVTRDVWGFELFNGMGFQSNYAHSWYLDLGIDESGGTNFTPLITNLGVGMGPAGARQHRFWFPLRIPSGSSIGIRMMGTSTTTRTTYVGVNLYGDPSEPSLYNVATMCQNFDPISITPSGTVPGTWFEIGNTTKPLWHWNLSFNTGLSQVLGFRTDLAYGDSASKTLILRDVSYNLVSTAEETFTPLSTMSHCYVPVGSIIYARAITSGSGGDNLRLSVTGMGG